MKVLRNVLAWGFWLAVGAVFGANAALDGIAHDCQKQTFFKVSEMKFECMEWKPDVIYWDPTPSPASHRAPDIQAMRVPR